MMNLKTNNRVDFDPITHTYLLDGSRFLIGVTQLMKKHGLSPDYSGIPQAVLDRAAEKGTEIHNLIEAYDAGEAVIPEPMIEEYRKLGLKSIASEYLVSDFKAVASSIDKIYDDGDGVMLVDIKTTDKVHRRALQWQLGIYKVLLERFDPDIKVTRCACLHIDKNARSIKGLIPIEPVTEKEVDALLMAEYNGEIYHDNYVPKSINDVLSRDDAEGYMIKVQHVAMLKKEIKEIEAAIEEYDKRVLDYMSRNGLDTLETAGGVFTRKESYVRNTFDSKTFKEKEPELYKEYCKKSIVAESLVYKPSK